MQDITKDKLSKALFKILFFFVALLFAVCFATLPLVINAAMTDVIRPPSEQVRYFTPEEQVVNKDHTSLHLYITGLEEVQGLAKIRVEGFKTCSQGCDAYEERILFFNADKRNENLEKAVPAYERVSMPKKSKEFKKEISLPMEGNLFFYPFDSYKLSIGVAVERKYPDGSKEILTPDQTKGQLLITLEDEIPRVNLLQIKELDPKLVRPKKLSYEYAYAKQLKFGRPTYIVIVVMLIIILSIAVTIFTMLSRPFDQLIINTSALIFGVWSIRSLLLTGYPSDITLLDTVLQTMVVFILMTLAFRGMNYFHRAGHMNLFPWAKAQLTRDCPECLTNLKVHAKRCHACSSPVDPLE